MDDNLLVIFIHRGNAHSARDHDISPSARIAGFVDTLPRNECFEFHLAGQDSAFIIVQTGKKRDLFEDFGVARHSGLLTCL